MRFYFDDDDRARRERIARTATASVAWTTTLAALARAGFAGPLSQLLLGFHDPLLIDCAVLGLWAFTNLEMAYAQLRVDERARTYIYASGANVALTRDASRSRSSCSPTQGARGLLLGNFGASALVVLGLWWVLRRRVSLRVQLDDLRAMLALRAADRAGRRERLRAAGRRPLLPVPLLLARRGRAVRGRDQARDGRVRRGARASSTRGRRWPTRSRTTRRRAGCTRSSRPTTRSPPASSSARSRCSAAGWCGCWRRPRTSTRTARCRGWRSAGRSTACTSCSSRSPAARG